MSIKQGEKQVCASEIYGPDTGDGNYPDGKNPSYISYNGDLYFIKWFYPLEVYKFDKDLQRVTKIHR